MTLILNPNMKLALVCLLVAQGLTAPSSSEEDMDMRNALSSSEEDDIDMRKALSSSEDSEISDAPGRRLKESAL